MPQVPVGILTLTEAAPHLGVTRDALIKRCMRGTFPGAFQHGRRWYIPSQIVEAMAVGDIHVGQLLREVADA